MNVMANQTTESLNELKFYTVPSSWFVRAFPFLSARPDTINDPVILAAGGDNWKDSIGMIENSILVVDNNNNNGSNSTEHTVSDDENDTATIPTQQQQQQQHSAAKAKLEELHRRRMQQNGHHHNNDNTTKKAAATKIKMKPGLVHTKDYFFLGPSAWTLVKEKFGFDEYEICRSCCKAAATTATSSPTAVLPDDDPTSTISNNNNLGQGSIAIQLLPSEATTNKRMIEIPPQGRFPYETIIPKFNNNGNDDHDDVVPAGQQQHEDPQPEEDNIGYNKSNVVSYQV